MLAAQAVGKASADLSSQQPILQQGLASALTHHPGDPVYVQSLLAAAMAGNMSDLPLQDITHAVKNAGCLHAGIRQVSHLTRDGGIADLLMLFQLKIKMKWHMFQHASNTCM